MKYRKKPVIIDAVQFNPTDFETAAALIKLIAGQERKVEIFPDHLIIHTLEGNHRADYFDFIIKGIKGELYPCKPDIFEATYEPV